jgi:energy-coupling factor transport system ATP-binding protein
VNEEWGVTILLGEHRLERCLAAADRVIALVGGSVGFDGAPRAFLDWALEADPALATPGARLLRGAGRAPAVSVREARRALTGSKLAPNVPEYPAQRKVRDVRRDERGIALEVRDLWVELGEGEECTEALRGLDLRVRAGERIALMGRNGAGKSTLLRAASGLVDPVRGRVEGPHGVALLPQRPGDMFVAERVGDELRGEAGRASLRRFGLEGFADADPRDLSGGERQRLALAIALAGRDTPDGELPGALLLDEPTRGMDRSRKADLSELVIALATQGSAVMIATHDVEFAVTFAERVILLGRGELVSDGTPDELLAGGWYFSSEVARILDGAAITVEGGIQALGTARSVVVEPASTGEGMR